MLNRLNEALGVEILQATTYRGQPVLKASSYVGVVRVRHDIFQILPKIDYGTEVAQSATRNLLYLLEQVGQFPIRQHDLAPLLEQGKNWFEILTRLFATNLKRQWQRGPYSHYQMTEEVSSALKGKWQISQQLRQPARQHLFHVTYDEFTTDNQLNRVFRYVIEQLWGQSQDHSNRRLLDELRQWLEDVTLLPSVAVDMASPNLISRLNRQYEPLLNLARLFLAGGTLEMTAGSNQAFAFVFDMNQLFEAFIGSFINRHRLYILPPNLQSCTIHEQTKGHTRHLAQTGTGNHIFRLKPDLAWRSDGKFPLLMDTKYKKLKSTDARLGISQADFYQMFAYSHRYQCPHIILLYPQTEMSDKIRAQFTIPGETTVITAATVNLHRDLSSHQGRDDLIAELREILTKEVPHVSTH